jgi:hypothetical protein
MLLHKLQRLNTTLEAEKLKTLPLVNLIGMIKNQLIILQAQAKKIEALTSTLSVLESQQLARIP